MTTPTVADLLNIDPISPVATPDERALLEWATAHPIDRPHPGMSKDGSRYMAPHPLGADKKNARTRVTTFAESLDDGKGLVRWRHRLLANGLASNIGALSSALDAADIDRVIAKALHDGGEKHKADIGTALHLACEHHLADTGIKPPAPWDADVAAFAAMLAAHQLTPVLSEAVLWVPVGDGLCGTGDLLATGPWGDELRVIDIKTGSSVDRIGYGVQLACYSHASHRWGVDGWEEMPPIDTTTAYIAHLPAGTGTCELVRVDATKAATLIPLASEVRNARRKASVAGLFTAVEAPPSLFDAAPAEAPEVVAVKVDGVDAVITSEFAEYLNLTPNPAWVDAPLADVIAWTLGRVKAVAAVDAPAIGRAWPEGVPTDPTALTIKCCVLIDQALAPLEARHNVEPPFPPSTVPAPTWTDEATEPLPPTPRDWPVDEGGSAADCDPVTQRLITDAFTAMDPARKKLLGQWARGSTQGKRPWAVGPADMTPRLLLIHGAALGCLDTLWTDSGGATECDAMTRGALSLVIGEDLQPAWATGAVLGALTIDQAERLAELADAFAGDDHTATTVGAKALALAAS